MKKLREVNVFTDGDSSLISTWSNVPFFLTETLAAKGIKVNRIDISPSPKLEAIFYKIFYRILSNLNKKTTYTYLRSLLHFRDTKKKIAAAIRRYPDADADIFMTFTFSSAGLTNKPIIQFGDWTYSYNLAHFFGRAPDFFETQAISREDSQIASADLIIPLFPSSTEYMQKRYPEKNIVYLGNVINSLYKFSIEDIDIKSNSYKILFVGSNKYIEGAKELIVAFKLIKETYPSLTLDIIGIKTNEFEVLPADVTCYGYLDKGDSEERELYYNILRNARVFVNTTPKWSAFSASIEAMYFYTPVIVTPYEEFLKTFGQNIDFGYYCEENNAVLIKNKIIDILQHKSYKQLCINANNAVKDFTWEVYINKMVEKIEEITK